MTSNAVAKTWELVVGADGKRHSKPPLDNLAPTIPTNPLAQAVNSSLIRVSWTASIDSQSVVAYYIVERATSFAGTYTQVGTPAATTYDDSSVAQSTTYYYRIKAVDGSPLANVSAASAIVNATTPAGAALQWAVFEPDYVSVIEGQAGWGFNQPGGSGAHLTTPATTVCIVNTRSNDRTLGTLYQASPPIYKCSLPFAMRMSVPRVIVFEVSGVCDLQRTENASAPYMTYAGQTAPSPGFFIKNGSMRVLGGNQVVWHMQNYNGDEASGQDSGARRNLSMGAAGTSNYVAAWCSGFWSSDQAFDCSVGGTDFSIVHCLLAEALCDSIHPKGVHGYAVLFEHTTTRVSMIRNVIAHFIERDPLSRSPLAYVGNNLVYNSKGQTVVPIGGYGMNPSNYNGVVTQTNLEANYLIKGPNFSSTYGGNKPIHLIGGGTYGFVAGSKVHLRDNIAHGFGTITTQNDLWTSSGTLPSGLISSSRLTAAVPDFVSLENIGALGMAQLFADTCGARPGDRAAGRDAVVMTHFINRLAGSGDEGTGLNAPPSGPITAANNTRDLLSSSAMAGDPLPNGTDRDAIQGNGKSKLTDWLYRQHLAVL